MVINPTQQIIIGSHVASNVLFGLISLQIILFVHKIRKNMFVIGMSAQHADLYPAGSAPAHKYLERPPLDFKVTL